MLQFYWRWSDLDVGAYEHAQLLSTNNLTKGINELATDFPGPNPNITIRPFSRSSNSSNNSESQEPTPPSSSSEHSAKRNDRGTVSFSLLPHVRGVRINPDDGTREVLMDNWQVYIQVKTKDLGRLMVRGFYWGPHNLVGDGSGKYEYINLENRDSGSSEVTSTDTVWSKIYRLCDTGPNPLWKAKIYVVAYDRRGVRGAALHIPFKLSDITTERIVNVQAWVNKRRVYLHNRPHECYNLDIVGGRDKHQVWAQTRQSPAQKPLTMAQETLEAEVIESRLEDLQNFTPTNRVSGASDEELVKVFKTVIQLCAGMISGFMVACVCFCFIWILRH